MNLRLIPVLILWLACHASAQPSEAPGDVAPDDDAAQASFHPGLPWTVSVRDYGAKGDGRVFAKASTKARSIEFTIADGALTAADRGKTIGVFEAGAQGRAHVTTIASVLSPTSGTLSAPAIGTVSGKRCFVGSNDEPAFERAAAEFQKRGGGDFLVPPSAGAYLLSKPRPRKTESAVCDWSKLSGAHVRCEGAKLISPDEYGINAFCWRLFKFSASRNVEISGLDFEGVWKDGDYPNHCGAALATFQRGCRNIKVQMKAKGASYGVWSGTYGQLADGGSKNWTIDVDASHMDYPVAFWNSGHASKVNINAEWVRRALYVAGTDGCSGTVRVRNFGAPVAVVLSDAFDGLPATAKTSVFARNIDLKVIDAGTDQPSDGTLHFFAGIACSSDAAASVGTNLKLTVEAALTPRSRADLAGFIISTNGYSPRAYNATAKLDNVQFGGMIDRSTYPASKPSYVAVIGSGNSLPGFTLDHFTFRGLTVKENPAEPAAYSVLMQFPTIGTDVVFDDVRGVTTPMILNPPRNESRRFIFRNCAGTSAPKLKYVVRDGETK